MTGVPSTRGAAPARRLPRVLRIVLALVLVTSGWYVAALPAAHADDTRCGVVSTADNGAALAGSVPVLFVHGMASSASTWWQGSDPLADKAARIPGVSVWAFDYSVAALDWVTDSRIGPALASAIDCLSAAAGNQVIVVAHSMGGLAMQYAVSQPDSSGGTVADHVAEVITLGTPYSGSLLLTGLQNGVSALEALATKPPASMAAAGIEAVLSYCAASAAKNNAAGECPVLAAVGRSPVGTALEFGSADIQALPPWPASLPVLPMAGVITYNLGVGKVSVPVNLGDVPVSEDSAIAHDTSAVSPVEVTCSATSLFSVMSSPCSHTNLISNPAIEAAVVSEITAILKRMSTAGSVLGQWNGTYTCGQGLTGMTLDITQSAGSGIDAAFRFFPVAANPGAASGSGTLHGTYSAGHMSLTWQKFTSNPAGYTGINLDGSLSGAGDAQTLSGTVSILPGGLPCTTFTLTRGSGVNATSAAMAGQWMGTYTCSQGLTGLTLSVSAGTDDKLTGRFSFYAVPANPGVPAGSYTMTGTYYPGGSFSLTGQTWINQPPGFEQVDLTGTIQAGGTELAGTVPQCGSAFTLSKSGARPPQTGPPTPSATP